MFGTKHGTQHYLVYIIVWKWLESKRILICLKLRAKLLFWGFLSVFGTFSHKLLQTWFLCHETWHTTLFGINYFFAIFEIQNYSHMLEITCLVAFLRFLKRFWQFVAYRGSNLVRLPRNMAHNTVWYILLCWNG